MSFSLHPQLEKDTIHVGDLPLCRVLLMNNRHFPWVILVPRCEDIREIFELESANYQTLMQEVHDTAKQLQQHIGAQKMNIAALGNIVPQLHIHIIARFENDAAWPKPVWGATAEHYTADDAKKAVFALQKTLKL